MAEDMARSLSWLINPITNVRFAVKFVVSKDGRKAWLTVDFNPTSLTVGNNVHPAAFIDPQTGLPVIGPPRVGRP